MRDEGIVSERLHRERANRLCLLLLAAHIPVLAGVGAAMDSGIGAALLVSVLLLVGPAALFLTDKASNLTTASLAVASMGISGLLIYLGHGMIEMHFHVFASLAFLIVFGRSWPILVAGATIVLHHALFWIFMPSGVFNYKAGFGIVILHGVFVTFEAIPCCWIARHLGRAIRAQGIVSEQLRKSAEQVSEAVQQFSDASARLSEGASEQTTTIENTSAAALQMKAISEAAAKSSASATELVGDVNRQVTQANQSLADLTVSIQQIEDSTQRVSQIIRVIDGIAFQTNILALNAAVEAARAGESGMGFAVVADEVRRLAQNCANAAQDTSSVISASVASAQSGTQRLREMGAAIAGITGASEHIQRIVGSIAKGSEQQVSGSEQISDALSSTLSITRKAAESADQTAAASKSLQDQAKLMTGIVDSLEALSTAG
ncbi:MAG TPA: methyl-accepting chemotaxis protein [Bryobacteraceae bacterium]|nr:methyl-accepting chemotaxis protein [Bryobacteraceae bacterium]